METAKVDIRKLQLLNDRINQCIDALAQVRLSVHGLSHSNPLGQIGSNPWQQQQQVPGGVTQGFGSQGVPQGYGFGQGIGQGHVKPSNQVADGAILRKRTAGKSPVGVAALAARDDDGFVSQRITTVGHVDRTQSVCDQ